MVLIVDDSRTELHFLSEILRKAGFQVATAESAEQAFIRLGERVPDLILMDVVMPGQNGFQLTREIKKNSAFSAIPIIFCTSKNQESDRLWAMRQGASDFMTKPVSAALLLQKIRAILPDA
jgi:twitching motility two-component system response regulator PilH